MALKLYGHPLSLCSRRVLIVLAEKGIEFDFETVDFLKGEQKRAPYDEMMPFGQIPALEDGSLRLYESRAIARYIASKYRAKGNDLLPAADDAQAWALFEQYASVEYSQVYDPVLQVLTLKLFNPSFGKASDEAAIKESVEKLHAKLDALDKILSSQEYAAGPTFSLVDAFYMPFVNALHYAGEGPAIEQRKNLSAWWNKVSSRDSWKKVNQN